jgi:hypothetical protein
MASYFGYWRVSGGQEAGKETGYKPADVETFTQNAEIGLKALVDTFMNDNVPYYSLPNAAKSPAVAWQNYAHLARVQEWTALDDEDGSE